MSRFVLAITLTCVLSNFAVAGEVPSVGPAPTGNAVTQSTAAPSPSAIPTPDVANQSSSAAVSAVLTVLSLLGI